MNAPPVRWLEGDASIQAAVDRLFAGSGTGFEVLSTNPRRHVAAALLPPSPPDAAPARPDASSDSPSNGHSDTRSSTPLAIVLKTHRLATGRHPFRERIKRTLGRSPARREWQALRALRGAGVAVPRPLAYGRLASGDELLVLERLPGQPFAEALVDADPERRTRRIAALAETLGRLHASGHVHGDLQLGNLWLETTEDDGRESVKVHLLDLQHARRDRHASQGKSSATPARLRDLAQLELSLLRARAPSAWRLELRAALGLGRAVDTALRRFAADHLRGRSRRILGSRRGLVAIHDPRWRGERDAALDEAALVEVVGRAATDPARRMRREGRTWIAEATLDGRAVVVKGAAAGKLGERVVAAIRGSRARRAFENGRREGLLLARSARPLAWLEARSVSGLPGASVLVLERVGEADLDAHRPESGAAARALALAIAEGLTALHAVGVGHGDLKGSNVRIGRRPDVGATGTAQADWDFWLVDLEDLALPVRASDEARLTAWAQLNASLPDAHFDGATREAALARVLALLPFDDAGLDFDGARRELVRRSRAREHRWRGEECFSEAELQGAVDQADEAEVDEAAAVDDAGDTERGAALSRRSR